MHSVLQQLSASAESSADEFLASSAIRLPADHRVTVLLVDDQAICGEAVRRWLATEPDIEFHYCSDPSNAPAAARKIGPTVILVDLVMPDIDGLQLVQSFRLNPATADTPIIVLSAREEPRIKVEAFARGANDYLVKWPDKLELIARVRYHSRGYISLLQRNDAYAALAESRRVLQREIDAGASYVQSLLPPPMNDRVQIDWRYVPCATLAGDSLGYHWLDNDRLAIYVLDVTGHGVAPALLSVAVTNVVRSGALPHVDFSVPGQVLRGLNATFDMKQHGNKFFTMWYGVYTTTTRQLSWAGAGHPAGLLFDLPTAPDSEHNPIPLKLGSGGPPIGLMPQGDWQSAEIEVAPGSRLILYTDGVHEIHKSDGTLWDYDEFVSFVARSLSQTQTRSVMDLLLDHVNGLKRSETLDDDFSIVEVCF